MKIDLSTPCENWTGWIRSNGYGIFMDDDHFYYAHRVAYEIANNVSLPPKSSGYCIDHVCRNRSCINPAHLELVTNVENTMRGNSPHAINARRTHCACGQEYRKTPSGRWCVS